MKEAAEKIQHSLTPTFTMILLLLCEHKHSFYQPRCKPYFEWQVISLQLF